MVFVLVSSHTHIPFPMLFLRYSRRILWLEVTLTNNDLAIVAKFYVDCLRQLGGKLDFHENCSKHFEMVEYVFRALFCMTCREYCFLC